MGQPKVASVTWRDRIRRISQGFYETMGQQIPQTRRSKPMRAWSHVKILNRDLRSTVIFLRKPKGISQTFRLRGRHCKIVNHRLFLFRRGVQDVYRAATITSLVVKEVGKCRSQRFRCTEAICSLSGECNGCMSKWIARRILLISRTWSTNVHSSQKAEWVNKV